MSVSSANFASLLARLPEADQAAVMKAAARSGQATAVAAPSGGSFENVIGGMIKDVSQQQHIANAGVEDLVAGRTDNVHDVVLTAVKADLSVRMLVEMRNQLVQAYQEVMRMQL